MLYEIRRAQETPEDRRISETAMQNTLLVNLEGLPCHPWVVFYYTPVMPCSHLRAVYARVKGSMTLVKNSSDDLTNLTAVYVSIVRREDGRYGGAPHLSRNSKAILTSMGRKRPHSLFLEKT